MDGDSRQSAPPITAMLASFVSETPRDAYPEVAVVHARRLLLDTIAVTLAAAHRPVGRTITGFVRDTGRTPATASVIGGGFKAYAPLAAMANGSMSNALDYDEGYHLSTHVVPAALAVCEHAELGGKDLLDAVVICIEAAAKLTRVIDKRRRERGGPMGRGWWHVGLIGPISAAMTAARLMRLDQKATATAIGIATCSSGGFRRNMGTMSKGLHSGRAARDGIEAVMLASRGFTSDPEIIEAPLGFLHAVVDPDDRDMAAVTERLGHPHTLEEPPRIKAIPACTPAHGLIDTAIAALAKSGRRMQDIESVTAGLHPFSLNRHEANNEDEAGFCGAYLVAAALVHGRVGLAQVTDEATQEPAVRALMKRITHAPAAKGMEKITLHFKDGTDFTLEQQTNSRRLVTDAAVAAKFRDCAAGLIDDRAISTVLEQIAALERQSTIDNLMTAARGRP